MVRGWLPGSVAIRMIALWQCFRMSRSVGSRPVLASRMSVAVVRIPLVMSSTASHCILSICLVNPHAPHPFSLFPLPFLNSSVPQTLIAYSILGIVIPS